MDADVTMPEGADTLATTAEAALDRLVPTAGALGLAVSGGGDSVALLVLAADWAKKRGRTVRAATVDHGLRAAAGAEAAAVARLAARLGVAHETLAVSVPERGNLQARAREARLDALFDWATDHDLAAVALGHTRDDQAETVLMRLARGTGVDGLAGMSPVRSLNADECEAPWLVRPLLHLDRAALRGWLVARGIGWIEDPTNADPTYERVRARRALDALAPLGITAASLSATADRLQGERVVLRETAARHLGASVALGPAGELMVDPKAIVRVDPTLCERVLATCHYVLTGDALPPRGRTLRRVTALASDVLHRGAGDAVAVSAKVIALAHRGALAFCRDPNSAEPSVPFVSLARWDERVALAEDDGALAGYGWGELGALREDGQRGLARTRHVAGRFGTAAMLGEADWSRRLAGWWRAPALARKTTPTIRDGQGRPLVLLLADGPLPVAHEGKGLVTLVPVSGARHLAAERLRRAMVGA